MGGIGYATPPELPGGQGGMRLHELLTSPTAFFSRYHPFEEALRLVIGFLGGLALLCLLTGGVGSYFSIAHAVAASVGTILGLVFVLHLLVKFLGGQGSLEDTFTVTVVVGVVTALALAVTGTAAFVAALATGPQASDPMYQWLLVFLPCLVILGWGLVVTWIGLTQVHALRAGRLATCYLILLGPTIVPLATALAPRNEALLMLAAVSQGLPVAAMALMVGVFLVGALITLRSPG